MQARWRDLPTDFWSDQPFDASGPAPGPGVLPGPAPGGPPRPRRHRPDLGPLWAPDPARGSRILDLMSSWHSHLPEPAGRRHRGRGLGMNREELDANPVLERAPGAGPQPGPALPFPDGAFDAVVCTVSVEYLTEPFAVFREVARVLRPGGCLRRHLLQPLVPHQGHRLWEGIHEFERPGLVLEYFLESGLFRGPGDLVPARPAAPAGRQVRRPAGPLGPGLRGLGLQGFRAP